MFLICLLLDAAIILLLVYVVLSWVPRPPEPLVPIARGISNLVTPVLEPIRRVLPPVRFGGFGLDLSVIVVFLLIALLQGVLC